MKKIILLLLIIASINAAAQKNNTLSPADKLYGLSKFWQEVNYNFVYIDKIDRPAWDSIYKDLLVKVQQTTTDYAYYRQLQKFCAMLKDGHTNIFMPASVKPMVTMFGDYRLFTRHIDNKAIIVRTNDSKKNEIPIGSEIIEVNGKKTSDYINEEVAPFISSSTDYVLKDRSVENLLQGLEGEKYDIKIRTPQNKIIDLQLVHSLTKEQAVYPPFEEEKLFDLKWLDNKIACLALHSFSDPAIDSLFISKLPELYNANGLIIDLRNNGGGSSTVGTGILQYLISDTLLFGAKNSSRLHIPAYKAWGKYFSAKDTANNEWAAKSLLNFQDKSFHSFEYGPDTVKISAKRLVVPTVLLTSHVTASAAEDFLIYADKQKHMVRIGEKTFGSTGQPYIFDLCGGATAWVCTKKDVYPDGKEFVGYGIAPHIEVRPTLEDFLLNRDATLEKALSWLKQVIQ